MANTDKGLVEDREQKVVPIADPDADQTGLFEDGKKRPFVLEKNRGSGGGKMSLMLLVLGVIVVFGVGMLAFLSSKGSGKKKTTADAAKPSLGRVASAPPPGDLIPNDKVNPSPDQGKKGGNVDASDIERTKAPKVNQPQMQTNSTSKPSKQLGQVGQFEEPDTTPGGPGKWNPPPYGGGANEQQTEKKDEEALSKPSLIFTAHQQTTTRSGGSTALKQIDNLGLAPGYHVAARLEAMASTAVHAPVTATIEYNYERDGQVLIPAGTRAVGKISQADPSGLINITFSSLEFPEGQTVAIDAVGADMNLEAIKGKVTGKQTGKSMLVRSLAGIGQTAAMIVGAPSADSAFSENDLLRMRIADNVGNAGDEQIMRMMTAEHIVVSVPAGTKLYLIFEKHQTADIPNVQKTVTIPQAEDTALETNLVAKP
jgi:hypothetical protein